MEEKLEMRMYFFVIYQLKGIQQGIQAGHAALEYALTHGHTKLFEEFVDNHKTWIVLNGGTTNDSRDFEGLSQGSINQIADSLETSGVDFAYFREPDLNNALTSVCFICDERVWNYEKYPDFGTYILDVKMYEDAKNQMVQENMKMFLESDNDALKTHFPEWYGDWVGFIGGEKNVFLRDLIKNKKLA